MCYWIFLFPIRDIKNIFPHGYQRHQGEAFHIGSTPTLRPKARQERPFNMPVPSGQNPEPSGVPQNKHLLLL